MSKGCYSATGVSQLLAAPNYPKLRESDEQESQFRERHSTRNTGARGRRSGNIANVTDRSQGSVTQHNFKRLNHWTTRHSLLSCCVTWTFTAEWAGCWFGVDTTPTLTRHTVDSTPPDTRVVCRLDIDIDSDGLQRKGGPRGQRGSGLHTRRKNLLGDLQSFLLVGCFQTISDFLSQNIFDMDWIQAIKYFKKSLKTSHEIDWYRF